MDKIISCLAMAKIQILGLAKAKIAIWKKKALCAQISNISDLLYIKPYPILKPCSRWGQMRTNHEKQRSSQRKCREHLSNLPSHRDNATRQGISISQPCYEEKGAWNGTHLSWQCVKFIWEKTTTSPKAAKWTCYRYSIYLKIRHSGWPVYTSSILGGVISRPRLVHTSLSIYTVPSIIG